MSGTAHQTLINGSPTNGVNPWLDSLIWGARWTSGATGTTQLAYATKSGTDPYGLIEGNTLAWNAAEQTVVNDVLAAWSKVANIKFTKVLPANADFWVWKGTDLQNGGDYGFSDVPDTSVGEPLYTVFNGESDAWSQASLAKGGMGYVTLLHEFGHLLGLAHPHDGGGDGDLFPGVTESFDDYGDYNLNQGIWTTMTYNDGWQTEFPDHTTDINFYGWQATPMALDIAAVQRIYGKNTTVNTGGDTYVLPDQNGAGTYWSCIWDCGGIDTISNTNSNINSTINLNAAPLIGPNAGGYVSWANNIVGGYTIANGVVIENAVGGNGNDKLVGNAVRNTLTGGKGNDTLYGDKGNDLLIGGAGKDMLTGGAGNDVFDFNTLAESGLTNTTRDVITDFVRGQDKIDLSTLDANTALVGNQAFTGLIGANVAFSQGGQLKVVSGVLYGNTDVDAQAEFSIALTGITTLSNTDFVL